MCQGVTKNYVLIDRPKGVNTQSESESAAILNITFNTESERAAFWPKISCLDCHTRSHVADEIFTFHFLAHGDMICSLCTTLMDIGCFWWEKIILRDLPSCFWKTSWRHHSLHVEQTGLFYLRSLCRGKRHVWEDWNSRNLITNGLHDTFAARNRVKRTTQLPESCAEAYRVASGADSKTGSARGLITHVCGVDGGWMLRGTQSSNGLVANVGKCD